MRIRENLSTFSAGISKFVSSPNIAPQIGKVFGVITTENTPTKELFEKYGGYNAIGTILYIDYNSSKNINPKDIDLNKCKPAKPFHASIQNYPLVGELVYLIDGPSPFTFFNIFLSQKYYTGTINIWNNNQQNSSNTSTLGENFIENKDIRRLISFEGDRIYQGRKGNGIRFGSTVKSKSNINEWSSIGKDGDPITIIVNGYITTNTGSLVPNVEEINKEMSSIYMTSTQKLPLQTNKTGVLNNLTNPLNAPDYFNAQVIINADRVTLNSKKDEVMIFATNNVEINTKNVINLNADTRVHLNSNSIFLGPYDNSKTYPLQPVLLGYETTNLFEHLQQTLTKLASYLSSAVGVPKGSPMLGINAAGKELIKDAQRMCDLIEKIPSQKVFTS